MPRVSVIIPSRTERFLPHTVRDILAKAAGDIEVLAVCDGYWEQDLPADPRLKVLHHGEAKGMRACINHGAAIATGEYLLKVDAHCMFAQGFDEVLVQHHMEQNWIVIPRRYSLDAELWQPRPEKSPIDYHYLSCPITNKDGYSMHGVPWKERDRARANKPEFLLDETPSFQGSCWFMHRTHFHDFLGGMSEEGYGGFSQEPQEIGNKTWLGGGKVMTNKHTWYAHLHKGKQYGRGYFMPKDEVIRGHEYSARYWMNNQWEHRVHNIEWLIDRFPDMPSWFSGWQDKRNETLREVPATA